MIKQAGCDRSRSRPLRRWLRCATVLAVTVGAALPSAEPSAATPFAANRVTNQSPPREAGQEVIVDGDHISTDTIRRVLAGDDLTFTLPARTSQNLAHARKGALEYLSAGEHRVYGWNQALGPLHHASLTPEQQVTFQKNVLRSHASGVGEPVPERVTRLALLLRANTMARGHMGVRPEFVRRILGFLNAGVTPVIPRTGPLGTGDLQPMAEAGLVLTGDPATRKTRAWRNGRMMPTSQAVREAHLDPEFALESGEALPLISGNSVLTARYVHAVERATGLLDHTEKAFALFMEATRAEAGSLDARTHDERRFPEQAKVAERIRELVHGSTWMTEEGREAYEAHPETLGTHTPRVQDAVSVRAAPHIIGTVRQTIKEAWAIVRSEANASTSNPLLFCDGACEFVMGGNWDGTRMGHAIDTLNAQMTDAALLLHALGERLMGKEWSYGLTPSLVGVWSDQDKAGLNSGMVQVETVAAAVVPEMQTRAAPSGVLSRPVKVGQEDHNPMAVASVQNLDDNLGRFEKVLAVTWMMTAQGVDIVKHMNPAKGGDPYMKGMPMAEKTEAIQREIRQVVPRVTKDEWLAPYLNNMIDWVHSHTDPTAAGAG
ncbi:histidine ammonia-lyase [Streptomyces sp. YS-3]|uniref:HAL/PAL/TAL family ammonia-lyase n=1 Tax=Streptomyces sp. YS-3 TaxID=3381352 RepID=UPI003862341D